MFLIGCKGDDSSIQEVDFIAFEGITNTDFGVLIGGETTRDINIYVTNSANADRVFTILVDSDLTTVDPAAYTLSPSVTIPANSKTGQISVSVKDLNITEEQVLALLIQSTDGVLTGDPMILNVRRLCPWDEVMLNINFDDYASETGFSITDSSGNVVVDVPQGTWADGDTVFSTNFCLAPGTYTFTITDAYGDGICCSWGNGSYSLTVGGAVLASGGQFGASESTTFTLQ